MIYIENNKDSLNQYILRAIALHVAVFVLFFILKVVFNLQFFDFSNKNKEIQVIKAAVRVDVVAMPKLTIQELKQMNLNTEVAEPKVKKSAPAKETSEIEFKKKAKKVNLNNLLKNISATKIKHKKKQKKKKSILAKETLNRLILEGNKISKGASATGDIIEGQQEYFDYIQRLPDQVRPYWKLPSYLLEKELRCRIRIFIGPSGKILRMEMFESSGEAEYDKKAMAAVKKASPLPKPASTILTRVTKGEVILGFPL